MPTPKKTPSAGQPKKPESAPPPTPSGPADLNQLQQELSQEYQRCLQAVEQGRAAQQQRYVDAYNELLTTVQNLRQDIVSRGTEALQKYADALQSDPGGTAAYDQCVDAYHSYVEAVQQIAASRSEAEQNAVQTYQDYTTALQGGQDQEEMQRLGERAQKAYLDVYSNSSSQTELLQKVASAQENFTRLLQEAQASRQQSAADAYRAYAGEMRESLEQVNVQEKYQAAVQQYQDRVNEITTGTQRRLLEANLKALRELRTAWEDLAGGATPIV